MKKTFNTTILTISHRGIEENHEHLQLSKIWSG